ncbi:MAG TPA: SMP-30/gluconolactonase/LRE family protein [Methylomirabilota bacterium]|jgi:gluconolactonase|nr:SMP-30/gluconolactonase/LRE family protein [Methylomirabilota bacterium]
MNKTILATGLEFPEGPVCDQDGTVYVVEIRGGRIRKIEPNGATSIFAQTGGGPNGAARGPDGALYVTNNGGFAWRNGRPIGPAENYETARIERIDANGNVRRLYDSCDGVRLSAINDLVFDPADNFYFTDPIHRDPQRPERMDTPTYRQGNVYYASPDGTTIRRVATNLQHPNGIGLTPDGKTLLVAQTFAGDIIAFPILAPGELGEKRLFGKLPQGYYPDGFCLDEEGYVLVCGPMGGGIVVFDPTGNVVAVIPSEDKMVTNIAFGGPHYSTLYVTESGLGRVVAFEWKRKGLVLWPDRSEKR